MGARPSAALAVATLPHASEALQEDDLFQMLAGAARALEEEGGGCALAGGHTCEGAELGLGERRCLFVCLLALALSSSLPRFSPHHHQHQPPPTNKQPTNNRPSLGFAVTGHAPEGSLLLKSGLRPGDALVLTKPLGTGAIMAAAMRGAARARWVSGALESMQQGSGAAARVLAAHSARAATDVTGFGLLGHAAEMARASGVVAGVDPSAVPLLPGAAECAAAGHLSSLHPSNARALEASRGGAAAWAAAGDGRWLPLLVDPQTAGGLLAGVPAASAAACVSELRRAGYAHAAVVGRVEEAPGDGGGAGGGDGGEVFLAMVDLGASS